jgi:hypothetical protein
VGEDILPSLPEAKDIHSCRQGLGQIEGDSDTAADFQPKRLGNYGKSSASPNADVSGDRRHGQSGEGGYGKGKDNDEPRAQETGVAHDPPFPQVQDNTQDVRRVGVNTPPKVPNSLRVGAFFSSTCSWRLFSGAASVLLPFWVIQVPLDSPQPAL